jgi:hypothetical protein
MIQIQHVDISELKPVNWNPRKISEKELKGLTESLKRFGFVDPVIVNKRNNHIVGGHMRVRAAEELKMKQVPVIYVDLDDIQEKALNITLNSHTVAGKFDVDQLGELLLEIKNNAIELVQPLNLDQLAIDFNLLTETEIETPEPQESDTIIENYNFTIKCKSKVELQDLQDYFGVTGEKVAYDKIKEKL